MVRVNTAARRAVLGVLTAIAVGGVAAAKELVLYTASNPQIEKDILAAFKAKHPDIDVKSINDSTGPITQRIIAEKANPQADVVWMINDIALNQLKAAGALQPYEPRGSKIPDSMRDPDGFWLAHNATVMGMVINKKVLAEKKLPMPVTWEDLVKPVYKGQIAIAAATKSGTGLSISSTLVDALGWPFLENLHQNIFQYSDSGSAPARMAGQGEVAIGLSYDTALIQQVRAGTPTEMVIGRISPNVLEGGGLLAGAKRPAEAKLFMDWLFGEEAAKVFGPSVGATAYPGMGVVDMNAVHLWKMRRPLNADEFKREWAAKFEKK